MLTERRQLAGKGKFQTKEHAHHDDKSTITSHGFPRTMLPGKRCEAGARTGGRQEQGNMQRNGSATPPAGRSGMAELAFFPCAERDFFLVSFPAAGGGEWEMIILFYVRGLISAVLLWVFFFAFSSVFVLFGGVFRSLSVTLPAWLVGKAGWLAVYTAPKSFITKSEVEQI